MLKDWDNFPEGRLEGAHLVASDPYYEWYAQHHLKENRCVYHLCSDEVGKCKAKLPRGDRREVVHVQRWRLVNPLTMVENDYMREFALDLIKDWVTSFVPAERVPEPPGIPPPEAPRGPGGGARNDPNGLDKAAREAAMEVDETENKEKEKKEKRSDPGGPRGSVGLLLERRAIDRREAEKSKEEEKRSRKRKSRSRSRRGGKRRSSASSHRRAGRSGSSQSSEDFRMPSAGGRTNFGGCPKSTREVAAAHHEGTSEVSRRDGGRGRRSGKLDAIPDARLHQPDRAGAAPSEHHRGSQLSRAHHAGQWDRLPTPRSPSRTGRPHGSAPESPGNLLRGTGLAHSSPSGADSPQAASLTTEEERRRAARQELANSKLRQLSLKNRGQPTK